MDDVLADAVAARDVGASREIIEPVLGLGDVGLRIGLPKAIGKTQLHSSKELVALGKELVAVCRAKAAAPRAKGAFCVLVVTPSAPRAASICGILSRGGVTTAKLFGKHMSVEEQEQFLVANVVDIAVGTPARLAKLAEARVLELGALRYVLLDVLPDEKKAHFFSLPPKGMARRPDADDLAGMLGTAAFRDAFALSEKRAPTVCPVLLPPKSALESSTPVGQRMNNQARGRGGGGKGKGGRARGGIHKKSRPRASAFAMRPKNGSG